MNIKYNIKNKIILLTPLSDLIYRHLKSHIFLLHNNYYYIFIALFNNMFYNIYNKKDLIKNFI